MRAVIYTRVSTARQVQGVSLDAQLAACQAKADQNGWVIVGRYSDDGVSGRTTKRRPGLAEAMRRVKANRGVLVVYSLSRFARSVIDAIRLSEELEEAGCSLASVEDAIDTTTAQGKAFYAIKAVFARLESDMISERVRAANEFTKAANNGIRTQGESPYGYRWNHAERRREQNPEEQAVVDQIMDMFEMGESLRCIARSLDEQGVPSPAASRHNHSAKWSANTLSKIVRRAAAGRVNLNL